MLTGQSPYRRRRRKTRAIFLVVALFLSAILYLLIDGPGSTYLRDPLKNLLNPVPVFNHMIITHNGTEKRLFAEQTLYAHPRDRVKIEKVDTSVPFNRGVRLFSQGFDVNSLYEERVLATVLPDADIFHHYTYPIQIKHNNDTIGEVGLVIAPLTEDWLERANRIIDPQKRLVFLELAVKENAHDNRLKLRLADEYLAQKKWKQGSLIIEELLKTKEDLDLMRKLVAVYEHLRRYNQVISTLRRILAKTPDDLGTRIRLAELLEKKGSLKEARQEYMEILPHLPGNEQIVAMKNIGYLSFQIGQKDKALEWYLKAAEQDKNDPNLYYNIGSIYDDLKKPDLAEQYLKVALELRKGDIEGRLRLAQSLLRKGQLKDATRYANEILARDPDHIEALTILANIAEKEGDKKALRELYEKILSQDTKNITILFNLGMLEAEEENVTKSLSYFERLLKINPEDTEAREALFDICQRFNRHECAFQQAIILIKATPKKITYHKYIFNYLMAREEYEQSAQYMLRAIKENPKNYELRQHLILAYLKLNKTELAIDEMEKALTLKPNDTVLLYQLAHLKENRGDLETAFELYKKILSISPDDEKAGEAYLKLRLKLLGKGKGVSDYRGSIVARKTS